MSCRIKIDYKHHVPTIVTIILVAAFVAIALYLRVGFFHHQVFVDDQVRFAETDAYYHMRLVDNMSHHLPRRITFDPYTHFPYGTRVPWPPFFDWMIVAIAWMLGLGSPSQHLFEVVGAWLAPVLGAVTVIPVYFIGSELFNRWVGILSAGIIALLPGEFLSYSILGFCDHHAAETLFASVTILFLILSLKSARQKQPNLDVFKLPSWVQASKPLLYSLLAGVFFGIYLLTWVGGLLLIFILFAYFVAQSVIDYFKHLPSDYLLIAGLPMTFLGAAISAHWVTQVWTGRWFILSLPIAALTPIVLVIISKAVARNKVSPIYYPFILLGLGLIGVAVLWAVSPTLLKSLSWAFSYVLPQRSALDIWEMQPLLFPFGKFSLSYAWERFTTVFFFSLASLGILSYSIVRENNAEKTLFLVWSLMILLAVLGQVRFSYYLAVNAALLTGYLSWQILHYFSSAWQTQTKKPDKPRKVSRPSSSGKTTEAGPPHRAWNRLRIALGLVIVISLVFVPNICRIPANASQAYSFPDDAWLEALSWLKYNTPDPFGNPDFYYQLYESPPRGQPYKYPDSAYGIMSWWSYGHWITRIAHRIPVSNPFQQGASEAAKFFTAQDEASAEPIVTKLGVKYVIIDENMATGFYGKASWAGLSEEDFYSVYYQRQRNMLVPVLLFHPAYYRSLCVRLYNFDGKAVSPSTCAVISYKKKVYPDGAYRKEIVSAKTFTKYEDAEAYISQQKTGNYRIASDNPFISPVPLEGLKNYRLAFSSTTGKLQKDVGMVPTVKIFEYSQ